MGGERCGLAHAVLVLSSLLLPEAVLTKWVAIA